PSPPRPGPRQVPAPAQRRPAAAAAGGPGPAARHPAAGGRRDHQHARRLHPHRRAQPARRPQGPRAGDPVHHPRPVAGQLHQRPGGDPAPGRGGRGGPDRAGLRPAPPPLHPGAASLCTAAGPQVGADAEPRPGAGGGGRMTKRATIADIAERAGLSKGAVSYALNGQPGVSEATRQRVLKLAAQMGWRPNSAARALSASRAGALGLVMARSASTLGVEPFFIKLLSGIENTLAARSIALLLQVVPDHDAEVEAYRRWFAERRVDGIFLIDLRIEDKRVLVLEELGLPAVVIGGPGHH